MAGLAALATLLALSGLASAASAHFKHGSPSFRDDGLTLTSTGTVTGLGNDDLNVTFTARAIPTAVCTNPSGGNQPAGQNPPEVTVGGTASIPSSAIKNGNAGFTVTTQPPTSPVPGAPECPNPKWTETITDLAFTSATLTFRQGGVTVLTATCTFTSATSDGAVPSGQVQC